MRAGFRVAAQVDDLAVCSAGGPTASWVDLLVTTATVHCFGGLLHLTEEKAEQTWPSTTATFDGALICPPIFAAFVTKEFKWQCDVH